MQTKRKLELEEAIPESDDIITAYKYNLNGEQEKIIFTKNDEGDVIREDKQHPYFLSEENKNKCSLVKKYPHLSHHLSAITGRIYRILIGKCQPTYFVGKTAMGPNVLLSKGIEGLEEEGIADIISSDTKRLMLALLASVFTLDNDFANNIGTVTYKDVKTIVKFDPEFGFDDQDIDISKQTADQIYGYLAYLYDPQKNFRLPNDEDKARSNSIGYETMCIFGANMPDFLVFIFSCGDMQAEEVREALFSGNLRKELFLGLSILLNSLNLIYTEIDKVVPNSEMEFKNEIKAIIKDRIDKFQQAAYRLPNFAQYHDGFKYIADPLYNLFFHKTIKNPLVNQKPENEILSKKQKNT